MFDNTLVNILLEQTEVESKIIYDNIGIESIESNNGLAQEFFSKISQYKVFYIDSKKLANPTYKKGVFEILSRVDPNTKISTIGNDMSFGTVSDFFEAEKMMDDVLSMANPNWNDKQKLAFVHYQIGKMITYKSDFNNFTKDISLIQNKEVRSIWRSIVKGESVCNGISVIEIEMLAKLGIDAEELSTNGHAFVLAHTESGDMIDDATWDLDAGLFDCFPNYYGKTYEEIRKQDGVRNSHLLKNPPENVIAVSEQELREIYKSIGISDENGMFAFPLGTFTEEFNKRSFDSNLEKFETYMKEVFDRFPEYSKHLSELQIMFPQIFLEMGLGDNLGIKVANNVVMEQGLYVLYDKDDEKMESPKLSFIYRDETGYHPRVYNPETREFSAHDDLDKFMEEYKLHDMEEKLTMKGIVGREHLVEREKNDGIKDVSEITIKKDSKDNQEMEL